MPGRAAERLAPAEPNTSRLLSVAFRRGRAGGDPRRKGTAVSGAWDDADDAELPELDDELELGLDDDDDDDAWDEEDDGDDED